MWICVITRKKLIITMRRQYVAVCVCVCVIIQYIALLAYHDTHLMRYAMSRPSPEMRITSHDSRKIALWEDHI